jgi:hypothetical protein
VRDERRMGARLQRRQPEPRQWPMWRASSASEQARRSSECLRLPGLRT